MSNKITVNIDGIDVEANEGEYILNIARANDIFIPAICYLNDCSPTLACRICLVDVDGKNAYACNAKAKDGMVIKTDNEVISEERKAIMQVYDVNHPLQCGVCDQSGECELQNYTLTEGVSSQNYAIQDTLRPVNDWGRMHYDAGLCIVCERCVTVCKDTIGTSALKTIPRGGEVLDKGLKETLPKDTYAMWNKLQKSIIGTSDGDESLNCTQCGECISVCPVGALSSTEFMYKSNAWELRKIPASNPHGSDCSLMYYDVKHGSVADTTEKIYRVTNDFHYVSLSGAARFGYDYENKVAGKDKASFDLAISTLKSADTITFNSVITNEEALILQRMKEKYGFKLVNKEALQFQKFMNAYSSISGKKLYSGTLKGVKKGNFTAVIGSNITHDHPVASYAVNNSITVNKGAALYFHPVQNTLVEGFGKTIFPFITKAGEELKSLALLFALFVEDMPASIKDVLEAYGTKEELLEALGASEDFDKKYTKAVSKRADSTLIVGEDMINHPQAELLAKVVAYFEKATDFEVIVLPTNTNTLGVSLICELDAEVGENVVGYNEKAAFSLSALGNGNLDMPALTQQEGTFTNIDKRVVPTNAALDYSGYILNDIANALEVGRELTVDFTKELPNQSGYQPLVFDLLPNFFDNGGNELRGYILENQDVESQDEVLSADACDIDAESNVYFANPIDHSSAFTNVCEALRTDVGFYVSADSEFASNEYVEVEGVTLKVGVDRFMGGDMACIPTYIEFIDVEKLSNSSRYAKLTIKGV